MLEESSYYGRKHYVYIVKVKKGDKVKFYAGQRLAASRKEAITKITEKITKEGGTVEEVIDMGECTWESEKIQDLYEAACVKAEKLEKKAS
jgi:hypothetical protein